MVGARWPENDCGEEDEYISGDCAQKKLNGKMDHWWEKQRPRCKKLSLPHYFLGINTLGGRFGTLRFSVTQHHNTYKQPTVHEKDSLIGKIS